MATSYKRTPFATPADAAATAVFLPWRRLVGSADVRRCTGLSNFWCCCLCCCCCCRCLLTAAIAAATLRAMLLLPSAGLMLAPSVCCCCCRLPSMALLRPLLLGRLQLLALLSASSICTLAAPGSSCSNSPCAASPLLTSSLSAPAPLAAAASAACAGGLVRGFLAPLPACCSADDAYASAACSSCSAAAAAALPGLDAPATLLGLPGQALSASRCCRCSSW